MTRLIPVPTELQRSQQRHNKALHPTAYSFAPSFVPHFVAALPAAGELCRCAAAPASLQAVMFLLASGGDLMENECGIFTFYWPEWHKFSENGTLTMKVTGWEDGCHWTGTKTVKPTEANYAFWLWVIKEKNYKELINDEEFERLKQEFADKKS